MTITTGNPQAANNGTSSAASFTIAGYTPPAGPNKLLVVATAMKRGGSTVAPGALTVTFGGVAMTPELTVNSTGAPYERLVVCRLNLGSSIASGDIVSSVASSNPTFAICAVTLIDAAQSAPDVTGSLTTANGGSTLTTSVDNEMLIGIGVAGGSALSSLDASETAMAGSNNAGAAASYLGCYSSSRVASAAGSQTMAGWSGSSPKPIHAVLAFKPAANPITGGCWLSLRAGLSLGGLGALGGGSALRQAASATAKGAGRLQGGTALRVETGGTIAAVGALSGGAGVRLGSGASLGARGALTGGAALRSGLGATITGIGAVRGSALIRFAIGATAVAAGALSGRAWLITIASARLSGSAAISGSSRLALTAHGRATGIGGLSAGSLVRFDLRGKLNNASAGAMAGGSSLRLSLGGRLDAVGALAAGANIRLLSQAKISDTFWGPWKLKTPATSEWAETPPLVDAWTAKPPPSGFWN